MRYNQLIIVTALIFCVQNKLAASENVPTWSVDSTYEASLGFQVAGDYAGGTFELACTSQTFQIDVDEIALQTLAHGSQASYLCYTASYAGAITGAGAIDLWEPLVLTTDVEIRDGSLTGYFWVATETLQVVRRLLVVEGEAWGYLFENWQDLGTIRFVLAHEVDPPANEFDFPLDLGTDWSQTSTHYIFGDININIAIFGQPYIVDQHIETMTVGAFTYNATTSESVNGCSSYKITADDSASAATQTIHYCPERKWYSRYQLENLVLSSEGFEDDLQLINYTLDIFNASHYYSPTPTVTPLPTATPSSTPYELGLTLVMPSTYYRTGDECFLTAILTNPGPRQLYSVPVVVLLAFGDQYWFWPSWGNDFDHQLKTVPIGATALTIIDSFAWPPDTGGPVEGLLFIGGMLTNDMTAILGFYSDFPFGYGP